jgi:hypothetical protein
MLTQHQVRKYAKVERFEKLTLIDDMIKALEASKKELRDQLVAEGLAEYRVTQVSEYVVKAHERKTFKKI